MAKKKKSNKPRIPVEADGMLVNCCKNPLCPKFGVPASQESQKLGRPRNTKGGDQYHKSSKGRGKAKTVPSLVCKRCGASFTMKSNLAISEELRRRTRRRQKPHVQLCCLVVDCEHHSHSVVTNPRHCIPFGETTASNPSFRCG